MRFADILRALNYTVKTERYDGEVSKVWSKNEQNDENFDENLGF